MNQGPRRISLLEKNGGKKSRGTIPLKHKLPKTLFNWMFSTLLFFVRCPLKLSMSMFMSISMSVSMLNPCCMPSCISMLRFDVCRVMHEEVYTKMLHELVWTYCIHMNILNRKIPHTKYIVYLRSELSKTSSLSFASQRKEFASVWLNVASSENEQGTL